MKNILSLLTLTIAVLFSVSAVAADKVVVIPLGTGKGGPGDWTTVSVSSLGGIPQSSSASTIQDSTCVDGNNETPVGRRGATGGIMYLVVPIQLPDGATITSLTAVICDNTELGGGDMVLSRSVSWEEGMIARVSTTAEEKSTTVFTKTTTAIQAGKEIVDNSRYSYFIYMLISSADGANLIPIRGVVTLQ